MLDVYGRLVGTVNIPLVPWSIWVRKKVRWSNYPLVNQHNSNGKWTKIEDVFPIQNGDIPASYVSLQECTIFCYVSPFLDVKKKTSF